MATHEMAFARDVAHRVLFLDGGVVVEEGTPAQLFGAPREARTREFLVAVHRLRRQLATADSAIVAGIAPRTGRGS